MYCKQSCCMHDVEFSHKFNRSLPDCGQRRSPPSILGMWMPHPIPWEVRFVVAKFGLNRLRRSPSSPPNRCWRIHHACMHVGMQIQVDTVTCTLPWSDRPKPTRPHCSTLYYKRPGAVITRTALQIAHSTRWNNAGPKFCNFKWLHVSTHKTTYEFHTMMPPERGSETKFVTGMVPRCLDPVVHLHLSS